VEAAGAGRGPGPAGRPSKGSREVLALRRWISRRSYPQKDGVIHKPRRAYPQEGRLAGDGVEALAQSDDFAAQFVVLAD